MTSRPTARTERQHREPQPLRHRTLFTAPPGYIPRKPRRHPDQRPTTPTMSFHDYTEQLLAWVTWWNTEHHPDAHGSTTPLETRQADPTPLHHAPPADLWSFTLKDDGHTRTITSHDVRFRNRDHIADRITRQAGRDATVHYMPHHTHVIEVRTPRGRHLSTAHLADQATEEQLTALHRARTGRAQRLRAEAKAAEQLRREPRPHHRPAETHRMNTLTPAEAAHEPDQHQDTDPSTLALPDLIPPAPPPDDWATPDALKSRTRPAKPPSREDCP